MARSSAKNGEHNPPGRRVLITGAGSGVGKALALRLAASGHRLGLLGRRQAPLLELQAAIRDAGGMAWAIEGDVTSEVCLQRTAEWIGACWGGMEGLVNSAGIAFFGTVEETSPADWNRVLLVNLTGPFLVTRACLPWLRLGDRPAVVNVASNLGLTGLARSAAYCASKAGLVNLTRVLALDHAREGVRVNAVCPGAVDTPMLGADRGDGVGPAERRRDLGLAHPLGRVAQPEEIASAIEHLLAPEASFITGAVVTVDGGMTAGFGR